MPEESNHNERQQPTRPGEPQDTPATVEQSPTAQPLKDGSAAATGRPLAHGADPAAKELAGTAGSADPREVSANEPLSPTAEGEGESQSGPDASTEAASAVDTTVSADEVEAAMQQMLQASEKPSAEDGAAELTDAEQVPVSAGEVEAAMQEILAAAEPAAGRSASGGAARAAGRPVSAAEPRQATQATGGTTEQAGVEAAATAGESPPNTTAFEAPEFSAAGRAADVFGIDLLDDVELDVKIELGRTEMYIEDVLGLGVGSVVKLDKAAGDPVDIFVNDRLVARGEVLVLNDNFCVRINDILSPIPELETER
jgi:flagellar motor switch protein FliN/FliY